MGVIIPTFNSVQTVTEAVESVLQQETAPQQLIVVDDGSNDDTPLLLERYQGRLEYLQQSNRGPSAARNRGWRRLRTDAVVFLDADDLLLPGALTARLALLAGGNAEWAYTDGFLQDSSGGHRLFSESYPPSGGRAKRGIFPELLSQNFITTSAAIVRRRTLERVGGFDESMRWMEDWDLWLRLAVRDPVRYGPQPTFVQRQGPGTLSSNRNAMSRMRYRTLVKIFRLFPTEVASAGSSARRSVADAYNSYGYALAGERRWYEAKPFLWTSIRLWPWQQRAWWLLLRCMGAAARGVRSPEPPGTRPDVRQQDPIDNGAAE